MREARAVMVAVGRNENLRFMLQAAKRFGVNDAVAVALPLRAQRIVFLRKFSAFTVARLGGARVQPRVLALFEHDSHIGKVLVDRVSLHTCSLIDGCDLMSALSLR